jgi:hypothetical protein
MVTDWSVWEFRVWENWKCASMETPEVLKPEESKGWGTMTSPGGDVDPKISEVTCLADVTRDDVDTWDVHHVSVILSIWSIEMLVRT